MAKYIDKSALVAELEKRIKETGSMQPKFDQFWAGQISAFKGVLKILDTIEVKEEVTTDAFVKKACDFIRKMVDIPHNIDCKDGQPLVDDYIKYAEERLKAAEKVVESFKKYMEE